MPSLSVSLPLASRESRSTTSKACAVSPLVTSFLTAKRAAGLSARTLDWYALFVNDFLDHIGANHPETTTPETVEAYLAHLRDVRQVSPHTVSGAYRALSVWFRWLVARRHLPESPLLYVQRPRLPNKRAVYVTQGQYEVLIRSNPGETWVDLRDRCLLTLLYYSGLRISEALALRPDDLDDRVASVRGKGNKTRLVPCHPSLCTHLIDYLARRPPTPLAQLFVSNDGAGGVRGPLTDNGARQVLRRRCREAGLPYLTPHAFRHGFAMLFLNAGMGMSAVSTAMGHSSVKVTEDTYARWLPAGLLREYEAALAVASAVNS